MVEDIFYYAHNKFGIQRKIDVHQIKFHELTFLLDGKMTYYVNGEKYEMEKGDIIYLPAGSFRQREAGAEPSDYVSINFHASDVLPLKIHAPNSINDEIRLLLEFLDLANANPSENNPKKLVNVLDALVWQISDNLMTGSKTPLAIEIANYLGRHYRERITLEEISNRTFFSVAYCESEFRKTFGKSIIHYLIDLRVSEAKNLLLETSMPCSVISELVGFEDANYFSRIFKKRTGSSPLQFRASVIEVNKTHR